MATSEAVATYSSPAIEETPMPISDVKIADDVESLGGEVIEAELSSETASLDFEEPKEVEVVDSTYKKKSNTFKGKMT